MLQKLPYYPGCPICGDPKINPSTLAVRWSWEWESQKASGVFEPNDRHTGYAGILHGGLISALLDECMAWACGVVCKSYCVTGELNVRYRGVAKLGEELRITASTGDRWGKLIKAHAEARSTTDTLIAIASATFSAMPREQSLKLREALIFEPGDIDILAL